MAFENRLSPEQQYEFTDTHHIDELVDIEMGTEVIISGRALSRRESKNITFFDLQDETGGIQVVSWATDGPEHIATPEHDDLTSTNIGDYLGVKGIMGQTRTGQRSVFTTDWVRLARTEIPFPDMRSGGITDPAKQRYVDLAINPESMERFRTRSRIVSLTRAFMDQQGFIEVETPILQPIHGGASARPFETHHDALDMDLSLRIAPELYLKRLVVGGMKRVYEIGKDFRNEGMSARHNPEFTMMEAYAAGWDYKDQMGLTEDLVAYLATEIHGTTMLEYQGQALDLSTPWARHPMDSLVSEAIGREVTIDTDIEVLRSLCEVHDVQNDPSYGPGRLIEELFGKLAEHKLWNPTFVTDHPVEISPLAREHRQRPGHTERFEAVVATRELCNAFTELNDPRIQYERFKDQEVAGVTDDEAMQMDLDYIRALRYGLPPTAGMGIGIDRLAMLLTNTASIRDIILFPTMRPDPIEDPYTAR